MVVRCRSVNDVVDQDLSFNIDYKSIVSNNGFYCLRVVYEGRMEMKRDGVLGGLIIFLII